ncbi:LPXTG cell wall anchor domain-containing protein, partial [Cellulomonas septica]|nr:LPXTG cell wall anchor domain-containing protein [Cellulomonas septica]
LATTGSTALPLAVGAGVLVAAGGVLLALRHRRRPSGSDA